MTEKEFCKQIEYICKPFQRQLLLRNGSFNEILAYLQGYAFGAQVERYGHHTYTTPFRHWLAIKFSSKEDILDWNEYREIFPDEEEAIANLPILYMEFAESPFLENLRLLSQME